MNFFETAHLFILIKPDLLIGNITLFNEFQAIPKKNSIYYRGAPLWTKVEQVFKAVP